MEEAMDTRCSNRFNGFNLCQMRRSRASLIISQARDLGTLDHDASVHERYTPMCQAHSVLREKTYYMQAPVDRPCMSRPLLLPLPTMIEQALNKHRPRRAAGAFECSTLGQ